MEKTLGFASICQINCTYYVLLNRAPHLKEPYWKNQFQQKRKRKWFTSWYFPQCISLTWHCPWAALDALTGWGSHWHVESAMTFENAFLGKRHLNTNIDNASSPISSGRLQGSLFSPDYTEIYQEDKEGNGSGFLGRLREAWTTKILARKTVSC